MYQNIFISYPEEGQQQVAYVWDDERGLEVYKYNDFNYAYRKDMGGKFVSIYGDRLTKIKRFKFDEPGLFESDVSREMRVLTDLYLHSDTPSSGHHVLTFDIETRSDDGFPNIETADKEITAIAHYDHNNDQYELFILDPTGKIKSYSHRNKNITSCPTERDLLIWWLATYRKANPTIITGWNIDGFDIPYLYNRLKRVFNEDIANSLSPIGIVRYNIHRSRYTIAGVAALDYIALYKKFTYSQRPSYRLGAIGEYEVGIGKVEYEGTLDNLYQTDLELFIKYNLNDVIIVVELDKKMKLIELARFICHLGHVPYEDYAYSSKFIEGTIMTYLHRKGIICPNKPLGGRDAFDQKITHPEEGFTGAYVKAPIPGLYDWVYSLDLQSLYPSIIMSLNISPETKRGQVHNWDIDKHMKQEIMTYEVQLGSTVTRHITRQELMELLVQKQFSISSNGILYSNDKLGVIPEILNKWFSERVEYKNLMKKYINEGNAIQADFYDRRQHVQKILLNSIYGVLGLSIFRFYDLDNALAVTATGQDVIKTSAKFINSRYESILKEKKDHCIYIDTDSVYFSATPLAGNIQTQEDFKAFTIEVARRYETELNKFYDTMAKMLFNCDTHRFHIKGESIMQTALWIAKKRYAMFKVFDLETNKDIPDGKMNIKGIDVVRSSFPPAFAEFLTGVLMSILTKVSQTDVDKHILDFKTAIRSMHYTKVARNTSVSDVSKWDTIVNPQLGDFVSKTPAHVKAAITYNRLLKVWGLEKKHAPIRNGDKIKWLYLKPNDYGIDLVATKTYDDPPQLLELIRTHMDYDALFEKELANKLIDIYEAMGWGLLPTQINQSAFEFFDFI